MSKPERLARRTVYTSNWVVRCRATSGTGEFDHNEVAEVCWLSRREVRRMIAAGEIRDGFSLSGLLLYLLSPDFCAE